MHGVCPRQDHLDTTKITKHKDKKNNKNNILNTPYRALYIRQHSDRQAQDEDPCEHFWVDSLAVSGNIRFPFTLQVSIFLPYDPWLLFIGLIGCYLAGLEVLRSTLSVGDSAWSGPIQTRTIFSADYAEANRYSFFFLKKNLNWQLNTQDKQGKETAARKDGR